jgi:hypothetical protein
MSDGVRGKDGETGSTVAPCVALPAKHMASAIMTEYCGTWFGERGDGVRGHRNGVTRAEGAGAEKEGRVGGATSDQPTRLRSCW